MFFRIVYKSGPVFLPFCHNSRVWRTDGRTDRNLITLPRLHYMQRGKNVLYQHHDKTADLCYTNYKANCLYIIKMAADVVLISFNLHRMLRRRNSPLSASALSSYVLHTAVACSVKHTLTSLNIHRAATSSCRGHVDKLATEPFLLLHRQHGTGYRRS